ncbi:MAG TPA: MmcQ/YjbR family DNA-binding protein [Caulobacteraceae bacterium]|jgi:predicted DNA-binding protein (MmcQ/YjbR family)|nr:MmcQ/YjbR family DNA-binding protein [Caulobacteraceae bacterium]
MTRDEFDAACRRLPGVTMDVQWGAAHVYKVGGRIFTVTDPETTRFSLKVSDIAFEVLVETGRAIPAPYLARAKWVRFEALAVEDAAEMSDLVAHAHALVAAKLTRKLRAELGIS